LETAKGEFVAAENFDPSFALASFYVAVADNELRDADSAINRLEALTRRHIEFLPQAYLQLAYAHTKKYEDRHYFEALRVLEEASKQAQLRKDGGLIALIAASRVFLWSVMGGRLKQPDRVSYLDKAIDLGQRLVRDRTILKLTERQQILFEVHNALGIAYMRKGQDEEPLSKQQSALWIQAREHYRLALEFNPAGARTLQNQGTLLMLEGDQLYKIGRPEEASRCYIEALAVYRASFQLNSHDQFVHFRIGVLSARLGDWGEAERFHSSGVRENGSVKREEWDRLCQAIKMKDPSILIQKSGG
jgi:tetratricopeptide (TPR) repeat protein